MNYFFLFLFNFVVLSVHSQSYNYEYYLDDVVKKSFIYDISQNKNGELLIATSEGLLTFNGVEFNQVNDNSPVQEKFILDLFIDLNNRVWFSYYNGGFGYVENNEIKIVNKDDYVNSFSNDYQGGVAVVTNSGLKFYDSNGKLKRNQKKLLLQLEFLDSNAIFYIDESNNFYHKNRNKVSITDSVSQFIINHEYNKIAYFRNEVLSIISTDLSNSITIDLKEYEIEKINQIQFHDNALTISTINKGVFEYDFFSNFTSFSLNRNNSIHGLITDDIRCSFMDKEENLWMGTYGNGIIRLPKNRIISFNLDDEFSKQTETIVNSTCEANNKLFLGTTHGLKTVLKNGSNIETVIDNLNVITLAKQDDLLFIGTLNNGLLTYKNGKLKQFLFNIEIQPVTIGCIKIDNEIISVGTNSGLYIHDQKTNSTKNFGTKDGLVHNVIENFIIDKDGYYWIDSPNSPIFKFKENDIIIYQEIDGFTCFNISDFAISNDQLWITTSGDGVFKYENDEFTQYTIENGLYSDYIYFIEMIKEDYFVIGHKNGISVLNVVDSIVNFSNLGYIKEMNNLLNNSTFLAGKNHLWIGCGRSKVLNLSIEKFNDKKHIPELIISDILLNGKFVQSSDEMNLPYDDYYVSLKLNSQYLSNPSAIEYMYKLEGFDKQWTTVKFNDNVIKYQSIKDGDYILKLKLLLDKQEVAVEKSIKVHISKPFWLSIWFYLVLLISLVSIFILVILLIQRRNSIITSSLEKKVLKRTEIINEKSIHLKEISEEYLKEKENAQFITKELTDSINYASYIQKAIMRKKEYLMLGTFLKEFFIIFKPKDLISGDFYWGTKIKDYIYVIASDCTGHGVPGALLSLLGISQLNNIITKPLGTNEILNKLRTSIIEALSQDNPSSMKDGMDMAAIRFNVKTFELQFSGAHNTVLILRKGNVEIVNSAVNVLKVENDLTLYNIKPNRQPISMYINMDDFQAHTVQLIEGDQVVMSTDGYFDQFGGPKNKKFMKKRFYQLLMDNHEMSALEQKKLLWNTIMDWKGETSQIDDITVISFKV